MLTGDNRRAAHEVRPETPARQRISCAAKSVFVLDAEWHIWRTHVCVSPITYFFLLMREAVRID